MRRKILINADLEDILQYKIDLTKYKSDDIIKIKLRVTSDERKSFVKSVEYKKLAKMCTVKFAPKIDFSVRNDDNTDNSNTISNVHCHIDILKKLVDDEHNDIISKMFDTIIRP
jgi:hypothetical protein